MADPNTALPEQSPTGTPPQQQQAQVQTPPAPQPVIITGNEPPAPPPPPQQPPDGAPTPEQIAQWRTQAEQAQQLQQTLQQQQDQYRQLQGEFTRRSQALAQLTGANPQAAPQDPIAPYVQELVQQGYPERDARAIATTQYKMTQQYVAPLQQQLQQTQAAATASQTVEPVMAQLYQQMPGLFQNPGVYEQTKQGLIAQAANNGLVDMEQAIMTASALSAQAAYRQQMQQPPQFPPMVPYQPQAQQPPQYQPGQPIPQPHANGMFRVMPNFQQQTPQPAALPADAQQVDADMRSYFKLPPKTA